VLDLSASGLRIKTHLPVPCGTLVDIYTETTTARGTVCRCEGVGGSFVIGVAEAHTSPLQNELEHAPIRAI
jgi:hypothetical protein